MAVAQVAHPEHEREFSVPHGDHRVLAKHQGLRALLGLGHLDEHAANEEGVHDGAEDGLEEEENDALGALVGNVAVAIADGSLGLDEEEEGGGEVINIGHAGRIVANVGFVQVAPSVGDHPPHGRHEEPGHRVGKDEDEEVPAPLEVHQGGEEVREVAARLAAQVAVLHIAPAVLVHEPLPLLLGHKLLLRALARPLGLQARAAGRGGHYLVIVPKFPSECRHNTEGRARFKTRSGGAGAERCKPAPIRRWGRGREGGQKRARRGWGAHPAGSCALCPLRTPLFPRDGGFLSKLSLNTRKCSPALKAGGMQGPGTQAQFCLQAFRGFSFLPPPSASRATFRLATALPTTQQPSQTDFLKINELTGESHPTCQLARLPKLRYLLGPDPPPSPPLPDRPPPGTAPGSPRHSRLLSFGQNPAQRHVCRAPVQHPPTHALRAQSPGLRTPETRPPGVGGLLSFRGRPQGPRADSQGPPGRPRAQRRRGGARNPSTHPPGEGRRRRSGRQRQPGLALRAQGCFPHPHFSWCTTVGTNAGPPSSAPP